MEDDNTRATVEIRMSGDESTDSEDENTSKEEEDGDGEEPSGITLHSEGTHHARRACRVASDGYYRPCKPSGPKKSLKEAAMTTEEQGQEQEPDGTEGGEAQEHGN